MAEVSLNNLPKEFRLSYQISELLYNNIVMIYNSCMDSKVFDTKIKIKSKNHISVFSKLKDEKLFDWLLKNNYQVDHFLIIYKLIVKALIFDFLTYVSEALLNILKSNLVISYTLLRKPFKENLTLLEVIYTDPIKFYENFLINNKNYYNPTKKTSVDKLKLIKQIYDKLGIIKYFSPELLFALRFDRYKMYSYDGYFNQAIHLVTDAKGIETRNHNLNFIFSNEDDKYQQMVNLFQSLPIVLYYSNYLIEEVIKFFAKSPLDIENSFKKRIDFGMLLWSYDVHISGSTKKKIDKMFKDVENEMNILCPKCKNKIRFNKNFLLNYSINWKIICNRCRLEIDLSKNFEKNISYSKNIFI